MCAVKPLLSIRNLTKTFRRQDGLLGGGSHVVRAVDDVSLDIPKGSTVGLVGESGSGKSTLGRCVIRLIRADSGSIVWNGGNEETTDVTALQDEGLRAFRRRMQIVFQDPYHSLNPMRPVWQIVGEGLFVAAGVPADRSSDRPERLSPRTIRERAATMLQAVGMQADHLDRYPHEFSGGQRQRIAIARALIVEPEFLVCDEITSALDMRTQAQVLDLIAHIRNRTGITMLFISHDLHTVARVSDEVVVMRTGRIVERGSPTEIFSNPGESYTRTLVAAVPNHDPRQRTFRRSYASGRSATTDM